MATEYYRVAMESSCLDLTIVWATISKLLPAPLGVDNLDTFPRAIVSSGSFRALGLGPVRWRYLHSGTKWREDITSL